MSDISIKHFKEAIKLSIDRGNVATQNSANGNLGSLYRDIGENNKAINIFKSTLPYFQKIKDYQYTIVTLLDIAKIYMDLKKYKISDEF